MQLSTCRTFIPVEEVENLLANFAEHVDNLYRPYTSENNQAWDSKDNFIKEKLF